MSNIIGLLENVGRDASMRHASREKLLQSIQRDGIDAFAQTVLLRPQRSAIDAMLGVRETMYCSNEKIAPPKKKAPAKKKPAKKAPAKKKTPAKRKS